MISSQAKLPFFKEKFRNVLEYLHKTLDHWDAIIRTDDGGLFKVHRCVLSAASTYFRSLFMGPISVSSRGGEDTLCEVTISSVSSEIMGCILKFVYSGQLPVTERNVEELLRVCDSMLLPSAVRLCEIFLSSRMTVENCIGIYLLSQRYLCPFLKTQARSYFLKRNHAISHNEEYVKLLSFGELNDLLRDDGLSIPREDRVFTLIEVWMEFDMEKREGYFSQLAHASRIGLCSLKILESLLINNMHIIKNESVASHIRDVIQRLKSSTHRSFYDDYYFKPRVPPELICAIGGWSRNRAVSNFEIYNIRTNKWMMSQYSDNRCRAYYGLAVLDGFVFCIGGYNGRYIERSVRKFNLSTLQWREVSPLIKPRNYVSAVAYKGDVYAIGGFDGSLRLKSCEIYDSYLDRWKYHREMNHRRSDASTAVYQSHIFVAGGFSGDAWLQSVEIYSNMLDIWTEVAMMTGPRGSHSLFVHHGCLYAVGGYDGEDRINMIEQYDDETRTWHNVHQTKHSKSNFSVAVMDGRVFLIGGFNGARTENTVEALREDNGLWKSSFKAANMVVPRSGLCVCVLRTSLFNSSDYSNRSRNK